MIQPSWLRRPGVCQQGRGGREAETGGDGKGLLPVGGEYPRPARSISFQRRRAHHNSAAMSGLVANPHDPTPVDPYEA